MLTASRIRRGQTHHRRRTFRTSGDGQSSLPVPQALRAPFALLSVSGLPLAVPRPPGAWGFRPHPRYLAGRNLLHELPRLHVQGFRDAVDVHIDHRFPGFLYLLEDRFTCLQGHDHNAVRPAPVSGIHPPNRSRLPLHPLRIPANGSTDYRSPCSLQPIHVAVRSHGPPGTLVSPALTTCTASRFFLPVLFASRNVFPAPSRDRDVHSARATRSKTKSPPLGPENPVARGAVVMYMLSTIVTGKFGFL